MNKIHPAYVAGVLDSDGSLSVVIRHKNRPNPTYQACFQLTWKKTKESIKFFEYLKKRYGGSYHENKPRKDRFKNASPTIKYFLTGIKIKNFLEDIQDYVILKKKQVKLVLKLRNNLWQGGLGRRKPKELCNLHHKIYLDMKKLNTKNSADRIKNKGGTYAHCTNRHGS